MSTYLHLTAEIARLQAQAEKLREAEKADVIARIREAISVYGISADALGFSKSAKAGAARGKSVAKPAMQFGVAKYRDPDSGKTWTGRGKPPAWIAGVKDRSEFLIASEKSNGAQPMAVKKGKGQRRAGKKTVGEPKYRDAATGKTWTGVGKPPLWIAGVEDRTPYLINP